MSVDVALIVVGAAILALGLPSTIIKRLWLSVPLLALVLGVLVGPEVLAVVEPDRLHAEHKVLEELARVALALSLVGAALQITREDLRLIWKRAASLLSIGMVGMWLLTSVGAWLVLDLPLWVGLLLGAILSPTDPVVASSLVTGRLAEANLPSRLDPAIAVLTGGAPKCRPVHLTIVRPKLEEPALGAALAGRSDDADTEISGSLDPDDASVRVVRAGPRADRALGETDPRAGARRERVGVRA